MSDFLNDRWNDILALKSAQWMIVGILSVVVGTALFHVFNWLYSQRFESQSDIIDLQKRKLELYAGQFNAVELPAPKDKNVILVLPDRWTPYVDQAVQYQEELREWQRGQQSANRIRAITESW